MAEIDAGELERLGSALRLAESALEEALEAAENLGNFDRRFDVPRASASIVSCTSSSENSSST